MICTHCGKEMHNSNGCIKKMVIDSKVFDRIPYGSEKRFGGGFGKNMPENKRCHDCNTLKGRYHHLGCDMEECPICGGQLIACGCWKDEESEAENE